MGNQSSKNGKHEWLDPSELYKTAGMENSHVFMLLANGPRLEDVEARLVGKLYQHEDAQEKRLRDIFDQRSTIDSATSLKCEPS
jgi:hypothetical protein